MPELSRALTRTNAIAMVAGTIVGGCSRRMTFGKQGGGFLGAAARRARGGNHATILNVGRGRVALGAR